MKHTSIWTIVALIILAGIATLFLYEHPEKLSGDDDSHAITIKDSVDASAKEPLSETETEDPRDDAARIENEIRSVRVQLTDFSAGTALYFTLETRSPLAPSINPENLRYDSYTRKIYYTSNDHPLLGVFSRPSPETPESLVEQLYAISTANGSNASKEEFRKACSFVQWSENGVPYYALRMNEHGRYMQRTYRGQYDNPFFCGAAIYTAVGDLLIADFSVSEPDISIPRIVPASILREN